MMLFSFDPKKIGFRANDYNHAQKIKTINSSDIFYTSESVEWHKRFDKKGFLVSLIRNTSWSALAAIILSGGRFLLTILLARKLGVSEFGKFAFMQWLVDMVFLSLAFGLPGSASRFFAELRSRTENVQAFEQWFLIHSIIVVLAVAMGTPLIAIAFNGNFNLKIVLLQAGWSTTAAVWALLMARAQGLQQFKRMAISNGVYVAIALAGCILLSKEGVDVSSAMLLIMTATTAAALVMWQPVTRYGCKAKASDLNYRHLRKFRMNIWITNLVGGLVWSRGEMAIVKSELSVSDLAIYSIALSLASIATQGLMLLTGALGPHLTQMWGAGNHEEAVTVCRRITDMLTFAAGILSIFLIAFAPELIHFMFGLAYVEAKVALAILGLGTLGLVSAAANQLLQLKTNGVFARNVNLIGAFSLFAVAIPLVNLLGINGAAISRVFVQIFISFITLYFANRLISVNSINWLNQAKIGIVIFIVILFNFIAEPSVYLRTVEFCLSALVIGFWLCDDNGRFLFGNLLSRFYVSYHRKKLDSAN